MYNAHDFACVLYQFECSLMSNISKFYLCVLENMVVEDGSIYGLLCPNNCKERIQEITRWVSSDYVGKLLGVCIFMITA